MYSVLIVDHQAAVYATEIRRQQLPELAELCSAESTEQARKAAEKARVILGQPDLVAPLLAAAGQLLWVQSTFAGVEPLCAAGLRRDYLLTGVKQVFGPLMSEYVIAHIIARERHLLATAGNQQQKDWQPLTYRGLTGLTLGVIGLGSIGRHVARTASRFGMHVLGMKRTPAAADDVDHLFLPAERADFLPRLDYLVLCLPATPDTHHFIRREDLKMMKGSAVLINVGRGATVDQQALITALRDNEIGGAILDVFEQEPLPPDDPLWLLPNVTITPHQAALSFPGQIARIFCDNYRLFAARRPLNHVVDFARGY